MTDIAQKFTGALADHYQKGVEAARNNVPRWKRPNYYDARAENAWNAGYDDETNGARPAHQTRSNVPEPTSPADVVAAQAATLLNDDQVDRRAFDDQGRSFTIRGVTLQWDADAALRVLHPVAAGSPSLGYSYVSPVQREIFFEAARSWHNRRRDELCAPLAKKISAPEPPPLPPSDVAPTTPRKRRWWQ